MYGSFVTCTSLFSFWGQRKVLSCEIYLILGDPGADSGGKGKTKRAGKNGAKKSKERREELFSPFFTFRRAIFFHPFSLSLAPTICPWVSEDEFTFEDFDLFSFTVEGSSFSVLRPSK